MKNLRVTVDGKSFDVTVELLDAPASVPAPARTSAVASAVMEAQVPAAPASAAPTAHGAVPSPLAGKVVSVDVSAGQEVTEGQQLLTLEAMKMNTFVYAPHAGKVAAVHVNAGDAVEEGAALLTIG